MREYFLNESAPFPQDLEIYYWPYPSRRQVVVKYMAKGSINNKHPVIGHVLKFLPLGFWLVWDKPVSVNINLNRLVIDKSMNLNEVRQIELSLYNPPALNFPESPENHEFILLNNESAVVGNPKK